MSIVIFSANFEGECLVHPNSPSPAPWAFNTETTYMRRILHHLCYSISTYGVRHTHLFIHITHSWDLVQQSQSREQHCPETSGTKPELCNIQTYGTPAWALPTCFFMYTKHKSAHPTPGFVSRVSPLVEDQLQPPSQELGNMCTGELHQPNSSCYST